MADSPAKVNYAHRPSMDASYEELYADLRRLAHSRLRHAEPITLLDTTSLVHESYMKLLQARGVTACERSQFLAYASCTMRSIIVDFVRRRRAERRGGGNPHVPIETADALQATEDEIVRVSEALDELQKVDERLVKVVEMRYFAGLSDAEIAESLGITDRTVRRDWKRARLLLSLALQTKRDL
jgi:RNA polymerase sigma factor (TIGR02999 family)